MHGQLKRYLDSLRRGESYRTDAVLKHSTFETTERVYFVGHNGSELGPYVRKRFTIASGIGGVYRRLWEAQDGGQRFLHLPRILECYDTESERVVVMEHVNGSTLSDVVYRSDPSVDLGLDVFRRLCDAVTELHERFDPPIIHRDLKPSNIMLSPSGLTIIDFGIARSFDPERTEDTKHLGTRNYAPPEQFGFGQTSVRSDIYSMGMVLYYCLTERTPTAALTETGFDDPAIPLALRPVLMKATRFDPQQRYGSVAELRRDLEKAACSLRHPAPMPADWSVFEAVGQAPSGFRGAGPLPHMGDGLVPGGVSREPQDRMAATQTSTRERSEHGRMRPFANIPLWVGIAWDVLLVLTWMLFVVVDVTLILEPAESLAVYEPWGRWLMGIGAIMIPGALIIYGLADKRMLVRYLPLLGRWRWSVQLLVCLLAAVLFAFFVGFVSLAALIR